MFDWKSQIAKRLRDAKLETAREADIVDELTHHFEDRYQDLLARGVAAEEAQRATVEELNDSEALARELRRIEPATEYEMVIAGGGLRKNIAADTWQDLRFGARQLRRNPGFAAVAIITLALGIAANTTIFSVVSAILLRKPPIPSPNRVVVASSRNSIRGWDLQQVSALDFRDWRSQSKAFEAMAAGEMEVPFTVTGGREPQILVGDRVTANYFRVLGIPPVIGRNFLPGEMQPGHDHVVVFSHELWLARYGQDRHVIGESIELDGAPYTIIGVMPPGTDTALFTPRLWTPLAFSKQDLTASARSNRNLTIFARLRHGITVRQAQAEMASIAARLAQVHPRTDKHWGVTVLTLQEFMIRSENVRKGLVVLLIAVGFVLLIACTNIAGLLLARGAARGHEMAIRAAVGASRLRLIRQMLAESWLLGVGGGAAGILMSLAGIKLLRAGLSFNFYVRHLAAGVYLDQNTLVFTVAISLLTAVLFGIAPSLRASKTSLSGALKEGGRTESGGRGRSKMRSGLVVVEISLAVVLLAGAGVMMLGFLHELRVNGFNPNQVVTAAIHLKSHSYRSPARQAAFFERVTQKLTQLPGISAASAASALPLTGNAGLMSFSIEGRPHLPQSQRPLTRYYVAGPGYLRTMQIPLLRGRGFSQSDNAHSPLVALASTDFTRKFFPKGNAIGQRIELDNDHPAWAEIVGIVGNVPDWTGQMPPHPQIYESDLQAPLPDMSIVVRSQLGPSVLAPMLRRAVWSVDKDQPVGDQEGGVLTMKQLAETNWGGDRLMVSLLGTFAALALALAAVGIYGVIAYSVRQRTHEIGIRMALGARSTDVVRLVLRQGGLLTLIGCVIGLGLALPVPRLFQDAFNGFGSPTQGPLLPVSVCIVVAIISLLATYIPARRAATVDPLVALRCE